MKLPNRDQLAARFLDGTEKEYDTRLTQLDSEIDNILANSMSIGDQTRIHEALHKLFSERGSMQSALESLREYRKERGLSRPHSER